MLIKGSFEDFIYIIIGLIWVAFSIYKGAQKKKSAATRNLATEEEEVQEEKKKKSIFDDFLDRIITEEEQLPYKPETVETKYPEPVLKNEVEEEKIFSYDDIYEESNFKEENDVYEVKPATIIDVKKELKKHPSSKSNKPQFDLRKAIIYSEIMNRRYF